jgi:hypothetical protein
MKWLRIITLASVTLGLLAVTAYWSKWRAGFDTPADCLDAYREACLTGDLKKLWSCLAEPLRAKLQSQYSNSQELADALRKEAHDVKSWVQRHYLPGVAATVPVDVDEVRPDGNRRIRFRLQKIGTGWLIVDMEQSKVVPAVVPYGTHVSKVPEQQQLPAER